MHMDFRLAWRKNSCDTSDSPYGRPEIHGIRTGQTEIRTSRKKWNFDRNHSATNKSPQGVLRVDWNFGKGKTSRDTSLFPNMWSQLYNVTPKCREPYVESMKMREKRPATSTYAMRVCKIAPIFGMWKPSTYAPIYSVTPNHPVEYQTTIITNKKKDIKKKRERENER